MRGILTAGGPISMLAGLVIGVLDRELLVVLAGLFCGLVLLALARLLDEAADIKALLAESEGDRHRIDNVIRNAPAYPLETEGLAALPNESGEPVHSIVELDGEQYMRANEFKPYQSQGGTVFTFRMPGVEPIRLTKAEKYYPGAKLFGFEDQVYVMLKALGFEAAVRDGKALLKRTAADE